MRRIQSALWVAALLIVPTVLAAPQLMRPEVGGPGLGPGDVVRVADATLIAAEDSLMLAASDSVARPWNETEESAFGESFDLVMITIGILQQLNATATSAARSAADPTLQTARDLAPTAGEIVNRTALDLAILALGQVDGGLASQGEAGRSAAAGLAYGALLDLDRAIAGVDATLVEARDRAMIGLVDGSREGGSALNASGEHARDRLFLGTLNETIRQLETTRANIGLQVLDAAPSLPEALDDAGVAILSMRAPLAGSWNNATVRIAFATNLPMPPGGPGFEAAYSLAGTGEWLPIGKSACPGTTPRVCDLTWEHALNGDVALRVGLGSSLACYTGQCAHVSSIHLDTLPPATRLNASQVVPPYLRTGPYRLNVTTEPFSNVTVEYTTGPNTTRALAGKVTADANGSAVFDFAPSALPGRYSIFFRARDRAQNEEAAHSDADASLRVIDSLYVSAPGTSIYFKNGDSRVVDVCVKRGPENVTAGVASVVGRLGAGELAAFAHVAGCVWRHDFGSFAPVSALQKVPLNVSASEGGLVGYHEADLTLTPARLVSIAFLPDGYNTLVPVGMTASVEILATYNDTGEPARLARVLAWNTSGSGYFNRTTTGDGRATISLVKTTPYTIPLRIAVDLDNSSGPSKPLYSLDVATELAWTQIVPTLAWVERTSNATAFAAEFGTGYRLRWLHNGSFVTGGSLSFAGQDSPDEIFASSPAGPDGLANITVTNSTITKKAFVVSAEYDDGRGNLFLQNTALLHRVNFTAIHVAISTNRTLANVNGTFDFRVNASYLHGGIAAGATVTLVIDDDPLRPITNVTLGPTGIGYAKYAFPSLFSGNVTAHVNATAIGVVKQVVRPSVVITATQLIIDPVVADDTDAHPGDPIEFLVTMRWATNGSSAIRGNLSLIPETGSPTTCTIVAGVSACKVIRSTVFSGAFEVSPLTDEKIHVVQGGKPYTPVANWTTLVLSAAAPVDALVDVNATVQVPLSLTYQHNTSRPAIGASIVGELANGTSLGGCTTNATGSCMLSLTSAEVFSGAVGINVTSAPSGVTRLASPVATPPLTWTRLVVDYSATQGPFDAGSPVGVVANVTFAHNGSAASGAVVSLAGFSNGFQGNVTDAQGMTLVEGIEPLVGTREIRVDVKLPSEGIAANVTVDGLNASFERRWSAIGFRSFAYSPAPVSVDGEGNPTFHTGTSVQVCATAIEADADAPIAGATISMRGSQRPTNDTGVACITIGASSTPRNVTLTAHGIHAIVAGKDITASMDRRATIRFVAEGG